MKSIFKKIKAILMVAIISSQFIIVGTVDAYVNVRGYTRRDGTYVKPHVRSNPNGLKIDNYGYKPSQGIYNKTYGTRGSSWDTPTTITDPDYYTGKALYESNQSGSSHSISPSLPNTNITVNNPPNSYVFGSSWYCNSSYKKIGSECQKKEKTCPIGQAPSLDKTYCVTIPKNAHAVESNTDVWLCDEGFEEKNNGCAGKTEKLEVDEQINISLVEATSTEQIENQKGLEAETNFFVKIFVSIKNWFK